MYHHTGFYVVLGITARQTISDSPIPCFEIDKESKIYAPSSSSLPGESHWLPAVLCLVGWGPAGFPPFLLACLLVLSLLWSCLGNNIFEIS